MLKVIGKIGCQKCVELKAKLSKDGVEFEYILFDTLPPKDKRIYANKIRQENNGHFPFVIDG